MKKVLFVCLGNICRSPLAQGLFEQILDENNLTKVVSCDSAGTAAYHVGKAPDSRSIAVAKQHGIKLNHRARQFSEKDFSDFDYIIAMDESNLLDIKSLENKQVDSSYSLHKMRDFDKLQKGADVPDPYYGGEDGFLEVYKMLKRCCEEFLKSELLGN